MRRPTGSRGAAGAAVLVVVGALLASCSGGSGKGATSSGSTTTSVPAVVTYPPRVALFGDSLSWEAQPYYTDLVHATGETALTFDSHGGTAVCDWLSRMAEVAAASHPVAAQLQFSGNALTACMAGSAPPSQAFLDKYRADTLAAIQIFVPTGAHVYLIGAPISRSQQSDPNWDALNRQDAQLAAADPAHVTYVDAGAAVEGPDHAWVQTLPCLAIEPCIGPVVDGVPSNDVRAPDGAHFCPVISGDQNGVIGGCPVYSSGAFRYANAMAQALARPA